FAFANDAHVVDPNDAALGEEEVELGLAARDVVRFERELLPARASALIARAPGLREVVVLERVGELERRSAAIGPCRPVAAIVIPPLIDEVPDGIDEPNVLAVVRETPRPGAVDV